MGGASPNEPNETWMNSRSCSIFLHIHTGFLGPGCLRTYPIRHPHAMTKGTTDSRWQHIPWTASGCHGAWRRDDADEQGYAMPWRAWAAHGSLLAGCLQALPPKSGGRQRARYEASHHASCSAFTCWTLEKRSLSGAIVRILLVSGTKPVPHQPAIRKKRLVIVMQTHTRDAVVNHCSRTRIAGAVEQSWTAWTGKVEWLDVGRLAGHLPALVGWVFSYPPWQRAQSLHCDAMRCNASRRGQNGHGWHRGPFLVGRSGFRVESSFEVALGSTADWTTI